MDVHPYEPLISLDCSLSIWLHRAHPRMLMGADSLCVCFETVMSAYLRCPPRRPGPSPVLGLCLSLSPKFSCSSSIPFNCRSLPVLALTTQWPHYNEDRMVFKQRQMSGGTGQCSLRGLSHKVLRRVFPASNPAPPSPPDCCQCGKLLVLHGPCQALGSLPLSGKVFLEGRYPFSFWKNQNVFGASMENAVCDQDRCDP